MPEKTAEQLALEKSPIVPFLVINFLGQWSLFLLLCTYAIVTHLRQRRNPFLINFILTTFIGTWPPALLLYSGHQWDESPPQQLCFAQAALVDAITPMFGAAQTVLVFDTWCELRNLCSKKRHISRMPVTKYVLIFAPYIALWLWTFASFVAAAQSKANHVSGFVFCRNSSGPSESVRQASNWFMIVCALIELIFEVWVIWMIYRYPSKAHEDPSAWRTSIQFAMRLLGLSFVQFIVIFLSLLNLPLNNQRVKVAYEVLTAMNSLATFVAFGTQKSILRAWRFWRLRRQGEDSDEYELQPQGYPMLDWADVPRRQHSSLDEEPLGRDEKKRPQSGYFKAWLNAGGN